MRSRLGTSRPIADFGAAPDDNGTIPNRNLPRGSAAAAIEGQILFKAFRARAQQPRRVVPPRSRRVKRPTITISPATKRSLIAAGVIAVFLICFFGTAAFWSNWWWFGSVGYRFVLTKTYLWESVLFILSFGLSLAVYGGNVVLALRRSRVASLSSGWLTRITDRLLVLLVIGTASVISLLFGLSAAAHWETWLVWWNA